jgi:hypothetical protein
MCEVMVQGTITASQANLYPSDSGGASLSRKKKKIKNCEKGKD